MIQWIQKNTLDCTQAYRNIILIDWVWRNDKILSIFGNYDEWVKPSQIIKTLGFIELQLIKKPLSELFGGFLYSKHLLCHVWLGFGVHTRNNRFMIQF